MRKLLLAGAIAGAAAFLPAAPASAQCIQVEGIDRCIWICPRPVSDYFACTL